jgi:hypothetical protein
VDGVGNTGLRGLRGRLLPHGGEAGLVS